MNHTIGIDNGLDGGITVLDEKSVIVFKCPMPTISKGKGREVDVVEIDNIIRLYPGTVVLEEASKHSPGKLALCSTWFTFGSILAILKLQRTRHHLVRPQKWQKTFWTKPKMAKGQKYDTKAAALHSADQLWPLEDWTKGERVTKPHDGMIDAALIAEWARREKL